MSCAKDVGSQHIVGGLFTKCPVCQTNIPDKWLSSSAAMKTAERGSSCDASGEELAGKIRTWLWCLLFVAMGLGHLAWRVFDLVGLSF